MATVEGRQFLERGHACCFYFSNQDLVEMTYSCMKKALLAGYQIIACYSPEIKERLLSMLVGKEIRVRQLNFLDSSIYTAWYGKKQPEDMCQNLDQFIAASQSEGFNGMLIIGDGRYISEGCNPESLLKAEEHITDALQDRAIQVTCFYSISAEELVVPQHKVLACHQYILKSDKFYAICD